MLLFTRSRLARCLPPEISTTSVTSATDTPQSSIVLPMPRRDSFLASPSWRRQRWMTASGLRRMRTGTSSTLLRRTAWAAAAAAIPTLSTLRARRAAVLPSGSMSLVVGPAPNLEKLSRSLRETARPSTSHVECIQFIITRSITTGLEALATLCGIISRVVVHLPGFSHRGLGSLIVTYISLSSWYQT